MGCGASSGAGPFSALDHGDIPSVVVHKRPADSGLPALVRDPFTADAVLAKLDGADKALRLERRAYEDERILQVLPDRRAERQERQKDYAYALGSLLAIQTLREAAAREKVPEILKPRLEDLRHLLARGRLAERLDREQRAERVRVVLLALLALRAAIGQHLQDPLILIGAALQPQRLIRAIELGQHGVRREGIAHERRQTGVRRPLVHHDGRDVAVVQRAEGPGAGRGAAAHPRECAGDSGATPIYSPLPQPFIPAARASAPLGIPFFVLARGRRCESCAQISCELSWGYRRSWPVHNTYLVLYFKSIGG